MLLAPLVTSSPVFAQETTPSSAEAAPVPPSTVETPAEPDSAAPDASIPDASIPDAATPPGIEINPPAAPETAPATGAVNSPRDLPAPAVQPSRLFAAEINYDGGVISAEGTAENPVRFETSAGQLTALRIQLDTLNQVVEAAGQVRLERETLVKRREIRARASGKRSFTETVRETLVGQNLHYDFKNSTGKLDDARVQLSNITITTESLLINGKRYSANRVVVRPGTLSEAETKIYGTPPLNIRAKTVTATVGGAQGTDNVVVKGGGLYFRNTRILPIPAYVLRAGLSGIGGNDSGERSFQVTPGISLNSADRFLVTTKVSVPLSKKPERLLSSFDIGISQRVGLRGGVGLESRTSIGRFALRARHADVVETQLTNRIELDRKPELTYRSPSFATLNLPGGRRAGFLVTGIYGDYSERTIGTDNSAINASRAYGRLLYTTQINKVDGPFLDLFATVARYGGIETRYRSRGFTIGYDGKLLPRVRGRIAYSSNSINGQTPFRFDLIEIARELRSTVDISLTPRYLLPIDLRYDTSRHEFRDKTFGLLRSYKTFAYGLVYQTARRDLRLEVRQGF